MRRVLWVITSFVLVGCSSGGGPALTDGGSQDGGVLDAGTGDGGGGEEAIPGKVVLRFDDVYELGTVNADEQVISHLPDLPPKIWLDAADGGFTGVDPSSVDPDGGRILFDVPEGTTFWVNGGGVVWVRSDQRVIDLGAVIHRLPQYVPASPETTYHLNLTGLDSQATSPSLLFYSNAGLYGRVDSQWPDGGSTPLPGASQVNDLVLEGASLTASQVDGSRGDLVALIETDSKSVDGVTLTWADRAVRVEGFTTQDGADNRIDAGLNAPQTTYDLSLDTSAAQAYRADQSLPGVSFWAGAFRVEPAIREETLSTPYSFASGGTAGLISVSMAQDGAHHLTVPVANPFPESHTLVGWLFSGFQAAPSIPDGGTVRLYGHFGAYGTLAATGGSSSFTLPLSPPRNVRVDGVADPAYRPDAGLSPTVSWDPPSSGTPTAYQLTPMMIFPNGLVQEQVGLWVDASTRSVTVPPALLFPQLTYSFRVTAVDATGDATRTPNKLGSIRATADAFSGLVHP